MGDRGVRLSLLALSLATLAAPARADRDKAAEHYKRGTAEYTLGNYSVAIAEFEAGFREEPEPAFLYNMAQAYRAAGRLDEAVLSYQRYLKFELDKDDRASAEQDLAALEKRIAAEAKAKPAPPSTAAAPARADLTVATAPAPPRRKWPIVVGVAVAVVAAAAIAVAIVLATRPTEPVLPLGSAR
jgi:tetratricopeptide (TPR) repeat protein